MEIGILDNQKNNNLNIEKNNLTQNLYNEQKNFFETTFGKLVNSAIDMGLKTILPDLIEDEVITIKNTILEQGFEDGLNEIVNTGLDYGKSAIGIITGDFDNINQVQMAVKKGGLIDSASSLLDFSINMAEKTNLLDKNIAGVIRNGKDTIMDTLSDSIEKNLTDQIKTVEKLERYCSNWNIAFDNQDIGEMNKIHSNILNNEKKIMPLEKIIMEIRKINNIHEILKNNGNNFNLSETELQLASQI